MAALNETWTPFTYSRKIMPSKVAARCDQMFSGNAEVPLGPLKVPPAAGAAESEEPSM
jgi:hypothetical protein